MKRIRFSELKKMALSPAHYLAGVDAEGGGSRAMRVGVVAHEGVVGKKGDGVRVFPGERRGKVWEEFKAGGGEIVTQAEWDDGMAIASGVLQDPRVPALLEGCEREKELEWDFMGLPCRTGGLDAIGNGRIIDLKTSTTTEPTRFARMCWNMSYPMQLVWYRHAAIANGYDVSDGLYILGVETDAPHAVTIFKLSPQSIELADKTLALWCERLKVCLENDAWPGYSQAVLDLDPPPWMDGGEEDDA